MPYLEKETETLPRGVLETLQLQKLKKQLGDIYGNNAFYTHKFKHAGCHPQDLHTFADISSLPFTRKSELVESQNRNGFAGNLTYPMSAYTRFHQTSGTTGKPLRVLDTVDSWDWFGRCWAHVFAGAGVTAEDRIFCAFSFGPFIGFWASVEGARQIGAMLVPGGGRSSLDRLRLIRETECTVLCCTPSYALHLLEVARENDFDLGELKIHTTIHAGEPGANIPATKKRIEQGWSARCHDHAGASEVGAYAFESRERPNGLFVIESEYIAEVIEPGSGEPVAPGEKGELILTNLGRWGFPVIRYRTGDMVKAPEEGEHGFMYLEGGIIGRADDMVVVRGVNIYPGAIENLIREYGEVDEYRVTVDKRGEMDELTIEVEFTPGSVTEQLQTAITTSISSTLGLRPVIKVTEYGTLPRFEHKARRFSVLK